ncbi:MAG TPA: hypothetical protein PLK27_01680 [Neisseria sp.]|jgi:hypothetical protein|nr:hypothetical protein [Neisseria sp.]
MVIASESAAAGRLKDFMLAQNRRAAFARIAVLFSDGHQMI